MKYTVWENTVNRNAVSLYHDGNHTINMVTWLIMVIILKCIEISNHYVVHQELKQCCRSIILQKRTNKSLKKRSDLWLPEAGARGRRNWIKVVKRYQLPVIRLARDAMYNMINIIDTAAYMKVLKRLNPKSSHHKEKIFFFYFVSIWDDGCLLNLLW